SRTHRVSAVRDALCFLTALPFGAPQGPPAAASVRWFPVVGLVIGAAWALCYVFVSRFFGPLVAAACVLVVDALITGALHLDAVADVADGVASRRPPDEAIAIMREPSVGAIGAAVLVLTCVLRFSALERAGAQAIALVAAPVAGRAAMALLLALVEPRQDGSLAAAFFPASPRMKGRATVTALAAAVVCVLPPVVFGRDPMPVVGLAVALAGAAGYAWWWRARFGPLTGDGVGAGGIFAETLALIALGIGAQPRVV
ncbi:MAG: adenosylcobinamide-GDP ribazoletransferase, partial [Egibacteraceae bacterium]